MRDKKPSVPIVDMVLNKERPVKGLCFGFTASRINQAKVFSVAIWRAVTPSSIVVGRPDSQWGQVNASSANESGR